MKLFSAPVRIIAIAAICIAALIGLVIYEGQARASGTEVKLAVEAVDPRALLQGHYVIIQPAETLGPGEDCPATLIGDENFSRASPEFRDFETWLALAPAGDHHRASGVAETRAEALQIAPVVVRGEAQCRPRTPAAEGVEATEGVEAVERIEESPAVIWTDIGVTRFYIGQHEAMRIERVLRDQTPETEARVFAIISAGQDGRARLIGLEVRGERLMLNWS